MSNPYLNWDQERGHHPSPAKSKETCRKRGYHDYEEFIDPRSGGFMRCKDCGKDVDCEGTD